MTAGEADSSENATEAADDATNPADWGLDAKGAGLSRETKIGLGLIAILLCAFTLVIYKRIDQARSRRPAEEERQVASTASKPDPRSPGSDKPTLRPANKPERLPVASEDAPTFEVQPQNPATDSALGADPFAALGLDESPPPAPPAEEGVPIAAEPAVPVIHPLAGAQQTEPAPTIPEGDPFAFGAPPARQSEPPQQTAHAASDVQLVADQAEPLVPSAEPPGVFDLFPAGPGRVAEPPTPTSPATLTAVAPIEPAPAELLDPFAATPSSSDAPTPPMQAPEQQLTQDETSQPQQLPADVTGELLAPGLPLSEVSEDASHDAPLANNTPSAGEVPLSGNVPTADAGRAEAGSTTIVLPPGDTAAEPVHHSHPVELAFEEPLNDPFGQPSHPRAQTRLPQPVEDLFPAPAPATDDGTQPAADAPGTYTVRPGDSFWLISRRHYGTARYYMALARYNSERIADPALMRPGMKIMVPDRETLEAACPDLFPSRTPEPASTSATPDSKAGFAFDAAGRPIYRTGAEDTLSTIAERHLGRSSRWIQIYEMNRSVLAGPDDLKVGTTLRLPADATPAPQSRRPD